MSAKNEDNGNYPQDVTLFGGFAVMPNVREAQKSSDKSHDDCTGAAEPFCKRGECNISEKRLDSWRQINQSMSP